MPVSPVTDASFAAEVLAADVPVLVDVWAAWCAPCRALDPILSRLAESFAGRAGVVKLDADANIETVTRFEVRALPTLLLFDRGTLVERFTGTQALSTLAARLERQLEQRALGVAPAPVAATVRALVTGTAVDEAEALVSAAAPTLVFKHSATCSISIAVKREYDAFVAAHPTVATRVVVVQQQRALSNALEAVTRVQHESPQALLVHGGRVLWHASHRRITAESLAAALRTAAGAPASV